MLQPYKEVSVEIQENVNVTIWNDELVNNPQNEKTKFKHIAETTIKKGDVINLELYETSLEDDYKQHVALFKIYPSDSEKSLDMKLTEEKDILYSKQNKRVTKKELKTENAIFSARILNKKTEDFFTDKENYGGLFVSNGTKIIQLFVSDEMMSRQDFEDSCLLLINQASE